MKLDRWQAIRAWTIRSALAVVMGALVAMACRPAARGPAGGDVDAESIGVSRTLEWIDRQGDRTPLPVPVRGYVYPRISPDGARIAVDIRDRAPGIWMWSVAGQTLTPFSTGRANDISPVWTRDGRSIVFARGRTVAPALLRKASDGSGEAETLPFAPDSLLMPNSLSPDAASVVVTASVASGFDLQVLRLSRPGQQEPLVSTSFDELNGEISPDGEWLAYQSRQSGQFEIWVRHFDSQAPAARQVSNHGGTRPVWARNGRELFYLTVEGQMMAVAISSGSGFEAGPPFELFAVPIYADLVGRTFDVSPDGRRFIAVMELRRTQ